MKLLHNRFERTERQLCIPHIDSIVVDQCKQAYPTMESTSCDLALQPPNHLSAEIVGASLVKIEQRSPTQRNEVAYTEEPLAESLAANVIVIGASTYNFSIPSQLKAWLDRVLAKVAA